MTFSSFFVVGIEYLLMSTSQFEYVAADSKMRRSNLISVKFTHDLTKAKIFSFKSDAEFFINKMTTLEEYILYVPNTSVIEIAYAPIKKELTETRILNAKYNDYSMNEVKNRLMKMETIDSSNWNIARHLTPTFNKIRDTLLEVKKSQTP